MRMPELQDKKNGKNKAIKRDRLLSQGFPLVICAVIIGLVLYCEMRPPSVSHNREPIPTKEPAPPKELQGEGEDRGDGKEEGAGEEGRSGGGNSSSVIERVREGVEAARNLLTELLQPAAQGTNTSDIDSVEAREFIEARRNDSEDAQQTPQDAVWGSVVFSDIRCRLADRPDLNINLTVELFYNSRALRQEVSQKQVILEKVAQQVISDIEFGAVQSTMLRARLLNAFNSVLETGKLWKVDIKNFAIDKG